MEGLLATPRGWIESFGDLVKFSSKILGEVSQSILIVVGGTSL